MELISLLVIGGAVGVSTLLHVKSDDIIDSVDKRIGKYMDAPRREIFEVPVRKSATVEATQKL